MRRPGTGIARRGGLRGIGGGAPRYSLAGDAMVLDALDVVARPPGTPGVVTSWTGVKGTVATIAGTTKTYSLTNIVASDASTHPGVQLAGARMTWPIGALLAGRTSAWLSLGYRDFTTVLGVLYEMGAVYTSNGRFACGRNLAFPSLGDFTPLAQGGGGLGRWDSPLLTVPEWPGVLAVKFDLSNAVGSTSRRIDNVEVAGTNTTSLVVAGSTFDNVDLTINGRADGSLDCSAIYSTVVLIDGAASAAQLATIQRYQAGLMGEYAA